MDSVHTTWWAYSYGSCCLFYFFLDFLPFLKIFKIYLLIDEIYTVKKSVNLMWLRVRNLLNSYIKPKLMCFVNLQIFCIINVPVNKFKKYLLQNYKTDWTIAWIMTRTLTRENSDIIFDIPFKRRYGLFFSNLMFTMKKKCCRWKKRGSSDFYKKIWNFSIF